MMATAEEIVSYAKEKLGLEVEFSKEGDQEGARSADGHEEASEYTKVEQVHYEQIRQSEKEVRTLELEHGAAKSEAATAKKAFEQADEELRHLIARGPDMQGRLDLDAGNEAWRSVPLADLGIDDSNLEKLKENQPPLVTIGDVRSFCEKYELTNVKGIGPGAELKIEQALSRYWQEQPQTESSDEESQLGDPSEEGEESNVDG